MAIRAVVFDLGGVLVDWSPEYLYRQLIPDEAQRRWFLSHVCNSAWNVQQDAGRSLAEGTAALQAQYPAHAEWIAAFYTRWTEMLAGPLVEGVRILEDLRAAGVPLYALTNWSAETFPYARQNFPFLQYFRDILVSGEHGIIKPEPAIYQAMFQRIAADLPELRAEELVFIDDVAHNIEGAQALGWHGIHHIDPAHTRCALQAFGLPI